MLVPCIMAFNNRSNELLTTNLLVLDESMSGWRPKTSKYGGLPNYTLEPRKPVPLGTMFRNGVDATHGILAYQDVVQFSEIQKQKDYRDEKSHLPNGVEINAHCAETLHQAEGVNVVEGGWVGSDDWSGSVMMAVELKKYLNLKSTFIIKNNSILYPTKALHGILRSHFGDKAAGHWIFMTTTIAGGKLMAILYAWSQRGVSYFLSTCGSTAPSSIMYQSNFEDEFGNVDFKVLPCPQVCHFLYEYLPPIDEHNKQHQSVPRLEKKWPAKDCWFCLLVTLTGVCVIDMHRLYRQPQKCHNQLLYGAIMEEDASVIHFSDLLCGNLQLRQRLRQPIRPFHQNVNESILTRILIDGNKNQATAKKSKEKGRTIGQPFTLNCLVCRKYLTVNSDTLYNQTCYCCKYCIMPLCNGRKERRCDIIGRELSCEEEHRLSCDTTLRCEGNITHAKWVRWLS
jgi:hypothetical protein